MVRPRARPLGLRFTIRAVPALASMHLLLVWRYRMGLMRWPKKPPTRTATGCAQAALVRRRRVSHAACNAGAIAARQPCRTTAGSGSMPVDASRAGERADNALRGDRAVRRGRMTVRRKRCRKAPAGRGEIISTAKRRHIKHRVSVGFPSLALLVSLEVLRLRGSEGAQLEFAVVVEEPVLEQFEVACPVKQFCRW
ncbi:hypothetical protein LMG29542_04329 [Paraburkholderia humisilvae]|uniref:Uncharacterized protein n=1 Tax=Paraburkholderia humisilvae TaxID=627669 RepID=A0A6J5E912_9BURK|nr:hypothetical protein LMG29542_04329 [Paraburkholderia humisilvae]